MKCPVCGNEIKEPGKFCPTCGSPITLETAISSAALTDSESGVGKRFVFSRTKGLSNSNYQSIHTTITIDGTDLVIQSQKSWFSRFKRPPMVTRIPIRQIQTISKHRTAGVYDLITAVVFLFLGVIYSVWWLLFAAMFAWRSMAVKYTIECEGQENVSFTENFRGSDALVDELFQTITEIKKTPIIG